MTIETRMKPRTEREKDLLKYGRRQERERIIALLDSLDIQFTDPEDRYDFVGDALDLILIIKGEQK